MSELTLDEYRLMMGTQLWIKESIFDFIESLMGGITEPNSNAKPNSSSVNDLMGMVEKLEGKTNEKVKSPKVDKSSMDDDLLKIRENFNKSIKKSKQSENVEVEKVDLSNCSLLVNDNSSKRDDKENALITKLKRYKSSGHIK